MKHAAGARRNRQRCVDRRIKRGERDLFFDFADKLEKATIKTIEDGVMTGDLYVLSNLDNKRKVNTEDFLLEINNRLKATL